MVTPAPATPSSGSSSRAAGRRTAYVTTESPSYSSSERRSVLLVPCSGPDPGPRRSRLLRNTASRGAGEGPPETRGAPNAFETAGASRAQGSGAVGPGPDGGDLKIGDFEAPERVPDYEVLEKSLDTRDGARAARLLIDTRSREEEEFVLI